MNLLRRLFLLLSGCILLNGCTPHWSPKVNMDLSEIDRTGLRRGEVAVSYEFCIPRDDLALARVRRIDSTLKISTSRGRIGCTPQQYLCIGHTHQPRYRRVLRRLARQSFINRIDECFFE